MIAGMVFLPIVAALTGWLMLRKKEQSFYRLAVCACVIVFTLSVLLGFSGESAVSLPGICGLGLNLETDGFRKIYGVILSFMWLMTTLFSEEYFSGHHHLSRYWFFNLMTLGSVLGVFFSGDLFTAFVFFEVMSFTSFPWVIQEETTEADRAAKTYLAVAVIGGLTALMGIFLLENALHTTMLSQLYEAALLYPDKGVLYAAGGCILFGFGAKAGMFPVHIWLPKAHPAAPAPASSLLSGALTKSGVWGILAVSCNIFRYDPLWGRMILCLGVVTMFLGALLALFSVNLKRTLACSSMSQIGFILVGIGMMGLLGAENALAARGTLLHMVNHSLFKLDLFLCAGVVYMNTHQLNLNQIRGFGRGKRFLQVCFLLGAAGIGGIPGLNGYISKTLLHESIVEGVHEYGMILKAVEWIFLISGGLTLAYMTKLYVCLFRDAGESHSKDPYMTRRSTVSLGLSALVLPALGLSAFLSMNHLADVGTDFLHGGTLSEAIAYYSFGNLKGALISIGIGAAVYILIVRKWMIRDGEYVDLWPAWLDLENLIYRPLLLEVFPDFFGRISAVFAENQLSRYLFHGLMKLGVSLCIFFGDWLPKTLFRGMMRVLSVSARAVCDLTDAVIFVLRRTIYRNAPPFETESIASSFSYRFGAFLDKLRGRQKDHYYARRYYRAANTVAEATHQLGDSLSFGLFMLCLTVCIVLIYVMVLHY